MDSPILSAAQMRASEKAAFAAGVDADVLMEQAGAGIARVVRRFFPGPARALVFVGKGNNGGDALVAARYLAGDGWKIDLRLIYPPNECRELTQKNLRALREAQAKSKVIACETARIVILDGLLGLGGKPPLREPIRTACREINRLRGSDEAVVFAIDLPTGLDESTGKADRDAVTADVTVTIGFGKRGLVADDALNFVGRLEVVALPALQVPKNIASENLACALSLRDLLGRRPFGAYKNQFGRVGLIAGSKGFTGAAVMCSLGALKAGAGLVEVFVPPEIYEIVAAAAPPEAMVKPERDYDQLLREKIDVWGIGPGIGKEDSTAVLKFLQSARTPMVVDADALNIVSKQIKTLQNCKGARLLTPHPGEMKRLFGHEKEAREKSARRFCAKFPVTLLLKGSRTIVAERKRPLSFNTTGNPGMATGGMGDVLTGVCAALIGQKLSLYDAARLGAWVCGRAAEIAVFTGNASEESLLPRDVLDHLGPAFKELRTAVA